MEKMSNESSMNIPKKKSVALLILLHIITLKIYQYFWYLKRTPELNNLNTKTKAKKGLAINVLVLYFIIMALAISLVIIAKMNDIPSGKIEFTSVPNSFIIVLISLVVIGLIQLILIIFLAFKTRKILNESLANKGINRKVSGFFTLFLNFFYLQYEINRIINDKEMNKRIGPMIWFIILYIVPILIGVAIYLNLINISGFL